MQGREEESREVAADGGDTAHTKEISRKMIRVMQWNVLADGMTYESLPMTLMMSSGMK